MASANQVAPDPKSIEVKPVVVVATAAAPVAAAVAVVQEDIMAVDGLFVKQKIDLIEVVTGYEKNNKYKVYELKDGNNKGEQMFKAKEDSECCERQCCSNARGFDLNVTAKSSGAQYLQFTRPLAYECFCGCRSLMQIKDKDGNKVGEVFHPFNCCRDDFEVRSPDGGEVWYTVSAGHQCSQLGLVCACPCEKCMEISFYIKEGKTDKVIGAITSRYPGCAKACVSDSNNYTVDFPKGSTFAQRASLFGAVFLIDFVMMEDTDESGGGGGY